MARTTLSSVSPRACRRRTSSKASNPLAAVRRNARSRRLDCRACDDPYLLPLKGNQPTLEADVEAYFRTAPASELVTRMTVEKGHGRIETRVFTASSSVEWLLSDRSYPGQPRFAGINCVVKVYCRTEHADRSTFETLHYICSSKPDIERLANGVRGH